MKPLLKNSRNLFAGAFFGQALTLCALPVLARLYQPEDFGVVATALFFSSLLHMFATLRTDYSIARAQTSIAASKVFTLAVAWTGGVVILLGLLSAWASLGGESLVSWGLIVATISNVAVGSVFLLAQGGALREGATNLQMRANALQVITTVACQILGASLITADPWTFIWSINVGYIVAIAYILKNTGTRLVRISVRNEIRDILQPCLDDMRVGVAHASLETMARNFPVPLITLVAGSGLGGQFAIVQRIVFNPMLITSFAVGRAIFHSIAQSPDARQSERSVATLTRAAGLFAFGAAIIGLSSIESMLLMVLGDAWIDAARLASLFMIAVPALLVYELRAALLLGENKQFSIFLTRTFGVLVGVATLWFLTHASEVPQAFVPFVFGLIATAIIGLWLGRHPRNPLNMRQAVRSSTFEAAAYSTALSVAYMMLNHADTAMVSDWPAIFCLAFGLLMMGIAITVLIRRGRQFELKDPVRS